MPAGYLAPCALPRGWACSHLGKNSRFCASVQVLQNFERGEEEKERENERGLTKIELNHESYLLDPILSCYFIYPP